MENTIIDIETSTELITKPSINNNISLVNYYDIECYNPSGNLKWKETIKNLVTTEGLNYLLDSAFKSGAQSANWYVGFKEAGSPAATDTAATIGVSPTAWTEYTAYSEATRPTLTLGTVSGGSVSNSGNTADITIASPAPNVVGVFIVNDNTKDGQSPATVLYGVGDFAASRSVNIGDTVKVTITINASSG